MAGPKRKRTGHEGLSRREDSNFDRQLIGRTGPDGLPSSLPLVHVTAVTPAKRIVLTGQLNAKRCEIFKSELLYFFVLRPAYSLPSGDEKSHKLSYFPVVFILRPEAVKDPLHVYPFDTGGAARGAFASQADRYIPLEDYALEPTHAATSGFIGWAFGSLESYFEGRLRPDLQDDIDDHECVAVSYVDIARMGIEGSNKHDKRASAIEVAASHNVTLAGNVQLMIFPKQFLEKYDSFRDELKKLEELGADVETYNWQPNRTPHEFQKDLMQITREWYRKMGIMK